MRIGLLLLLSGLTGVIAWSFLRSRTDRAEETVAPDSTVVARPVTAVASDGYVSSEACRNCHPKEYASWHDTYHRTMTQVVSPDTLQAPIDDELALTTRGRTSRLWREGDAYWIEMIDPDWEIARSREGLGSVTDAENPPKVKRQLVMSTGSHNIQTYWVNGAQGNEMHQVPWSYHLHEQQWIPLNDIFLLPPDTPANLLTLWNEVCIQCHTVHAEPGLNLHTGVFRSQVSELGIACEACHGPGAEHVALFQSRNSANGETTDRDGSDASGSRADHLTAIQDPRIVNPARLPHDRSAHVCGQCHSDFMILGDQFWKTGHPYRPGQDLTRTRAFPEVRPGMEAYWDDGTARVGGREFTAMSQSGCYQHGDLSCLSCHSMHNAPPDDQLAADMETDAACLQCHDSYRDSIEAHSHHPASSSGARCYNCHMPYSSFALMKSLRSHRIDSPRVDMTSDHGRPNACNQCHLDRPLSWTAGMLTQWYGQPGPSGTTETDATTAAPTTIAPTTIAPTTIAPTTIAPATAAPADPAPADSVVSQRGDIASSVQLLLTGDAVQRAVTAANFGWSDAQDVSGRDWPPALLSFLLKDPYAVVRFAAWRSLRTYPGFADFEYDFLAAEKQLERSAAEALEHWRAMRRPDAPPRPAALIGPGRELDVERIGELLRQRNDRPVRFPE